MGEVDDELGDLGFHHVGNNCRPPYIEGSKTVPFWKRI